MWQLAQDLIQSKLFSKEGMISLGIHRTKNLIMPPDEADIIISKYALFILA
jgi:hypothetical protein